MERKELVQLLDEIFIPLGFKRKGSNWTLVGNELTKIIYLQKSNFSKSYYINYGYYINGLELTTFLFHVSGRLGSVNKNEQLRINDLLDFENDIGPEIRLSELRVFISQKIVDRIQYINTQEDLLNELKKRPHLNDIPLVVKNHFNLV